MLERYNLSQLLEYAYWTLVKNPKIVENEDLSPLDDILKIDFMRGSDGYGISTQLLAKDGDNIQETDSQNYE